MSDHDGWKGWVAYASEGEELLDQLRTWLAGNSESDELSFSHHQIQILSSALNEALTVLPNMRNELQRLREEDADAHAAIRDGKGNAGLYEAARIKGWTPRDGRKTWTYPPSDDRFILETQYIALISEYGDVTIGDEVADSSDLDERLTTIQHCPLPPAKAIEELANLYGAASPSAMARELRRRREEIEQSRERLLTQGRDEKAKKLPSIGDLPHVKNDQD